MTVTKQCRDVKRRDMKRHWICHKDNKLSTPMPMPACKSQICNIVLLISLHSQIKSLRFAKQSAPITIFSVSTAFSYIIHHCRLPFRFPPYPFIFLLLIMCHVQASLESSPGIVPVMTVPTNFDQRDPNLFLFGSNLFIIINILI